MEKLPSIQKLSDSLASQLAALKKNIAPIVHGVVPESLAPLDQAQHYALLTYALDSIVFAQLKATGADIKTHPIMLELERVKALMDKIKRFETGDLSEPVAKSNSRIDKQAAARFIKHAIGGSNVIGNDTTPREAQAASKPDPESYLQKMAKAAENLKKAKSSPVEISDDEPRSAKETTKRTSPPKEEESADDIEVKEVKHKKRKRASTVSSASWKKSKDKA
jgi:exosome complex protein LRP1